MEILSIDIDHKTGSKRSVLHSTTAAFTCHKGRLSSELLRQCVTLENLVAKHERRTAALGHQFRVAARLRFPNTTKPPTHNQHPGDALHGDVSVHDSPLFPSRELPVAWRTSVIFHISASFSTRIKQQKLTEINEKFHCLCHQGKTSS